MEQKTWNISPERIPPKLYRRLYRPKNKFKGLALSLGNKLDVSMNYAAKVENILKGNLDLIPSTAPSVKTQIIGGKVCLRCKGKTLLSVVKKKFAASPSSNVLTYYLK